VVNVGGGTRFCTLGMVQSVDGKNVTLIDQILVTLSGAYFVVLHLLLGFEENPTATAAAAFLFLMMSGAAA
jgi:hypothetical protein